jgi:hypothetical protein
VKTYNLEGSEFRQKDFRMAGNRKKFYIQYADTLALASAKNVGDVYGYLAEKCFDENEVPIFDKFLESYIDGDFEKIRELQKEAEGQDKLMDFCIKVMTDFLLLKASGVQS